MHEASRAAGLARLAAFVPRAAGAYRAGRNTVSPPGTPQATSGLSPYLQRRIVCEDEVIDAVLARHAPAAADAFLQEVVWRSYWRGWLAHHPWIWRGWCQSVTGAAAAGPPHAAAQAAMDGRSGIACLDAWSAELVATGLLHNHVRMWFASIWIFTLGLPWALGAAFFWRHLRDADAASNTLGWRWVAGLQTPGKQYLARADNIARFTCGAFPSTPNLATHGHPVGAAIDDIGQAQAPALTPWVSAPSSSRCGWLLHPEDLGLDHSEAAAQAPVAVAALTPGWLAGPLAHAPGATAFAAAAVDEALARIAATTGAPTAALGPPAGRAAPAPAALAAAVIAWARAHRLDRVVVARPGIGPWDDLLGALWQVPTVFGFHRDHDRFWWPHASRGFFRLKKALPGYLRRRRPAAAT